MIEIKPPQYVNIPCAISPSLFLAGSIEMGKAIDWQTTVVDHLKDIPGYIFNPRRTDWDNSWVQSIHNRQFFEQVNWELSHLESCDKVLFNFVGDTKSPITLMELGLTLGLNNDDSYESQDILVVCPHNFWHRGNIEIICAKYDIRIEDSFDLDMIKEWVTLS